MAAAIYALPGVGSIQSKPAVIGYVEDRHDDPAVDAEEPVYRPSAVSNTVP